MVFVKIRWFEVGGDWSYLVVVVVLDVVFLLEYIKIVFGTWSVFIDLLNVIFLIVINKGNKKISLFL